VRDEVLRPGDSLPTVRALASELGVSPTTVASSYKELTRRGIIAGDGRRGTRVRPAPPINGRLPMAVPPGVLDLRTGGPDRSLLPHLPSIGSSAGKRLRDAYGESAVSERLGAVATRELSSEGVDTSSIAVVSGAMDGVERVLGAWLRPGDRVAVEDPGYTAVLDLVVALGLSTVPIALDEFGARPDSLERAIERGAVATVLTPRAQNPTGAAWDPGRAEGIRTVLSRHSDVLVVEDDHAGPAAGAPLRTVTGHSTRWATLRSVSKWLGPDLRLAVLAGDSTTVSRVEGRQALGTGWVSYLIQEIVAELWDDPAIGHNLEHAASVYATRRSALASALASNGIGATGTSGLTTWVPVRDEHAVVSGLLEDGIAVSPGERFRIQSQPGIRIAFASLEENDAAGVADSLARVLSRRSVRTG
jgi:DNA-binding transcriptional MocR family regulator